MRRKSEVEGMEGRRKEDKAWGRGIRRKG